jgi:hypothetical protein
MATKTTTTTNTFKQRITLFLNSSIVKQAKAQAIVDDVSLTELIEIALTQYLPAITIIKKMIIVKN